MTMSSRMGSSLITQRSNLGTTDEDWVTNSCSDDDSNVLSTDEDLFGDDDDDDDDDQEVNSSDSSSSGGPLQDMSAILQQLPIKKGLSKHYNGKSQSFTSLANISSLEDLAKPEHPYNKRLKSCKSYGLLDLHRLSQPHRSASSSRLISKKATNLSRGPCSSVSTIRRNGSFHGNKPPAPPPHRSNSTASFTSQTPLFA